MLNQVQNSFNRLRFVLLTAAILSMAACGGGSGGIVLGNPNPGNQDPTDPSNPTDPTNPNPVDPGDDTTLPEIDRPAYWVLELATGLMTAQPSFYDPRVAAAGDIVFRRVDPDVIGRVTLGSVPGSFGESLTFDEASFTTAPRDAYYIAVTELTREQWGLLARDGSQPWFGALPESALGPASTDPATPTIGVSYDRLVSVIENYTSFLGDGNDMSLRLPTNIEWEYACRAGTETLWSFGSSSGDIHEDPMAQDYLKAAQYAMFFQVTDGVKGPRNVARFLPNELGLYDMHGNVWEYTVDQPSANPEQVTLRGGSWSDNLVHARSANKHYLPTDVPWALAGIRLVIPERSEATVIAE